VVRAVLPRVAQFSSADVSRSSQLSNFGCQNTFVNVVVPAPWETLSAAGPTPGIGVVINATVVVLTPLATVLPQL
jgi:hypothetical protein